MDRVREFERRLVRVEGLLCVVLVLLILALAGYNVLYRNVLVPLQSHWAHSGPPVTVDAEGPKPAESAPAKSAGETAKQKKKKGGAGGFGGAFGGGDDSGGEGEDDAGDEFDEPSPAQEPQEEDGGFGGAFGEGAEEEEDEEEDDSGFGGAFGKPSTDDSKEAEGDEFFVEDEFEDLPDIRAAGDSDVDEGPVGGPPPPDSFAAWGVDFIDKIKLDWIDVFARHLVIIVSFLGAAIATRRQKHINIDALSKILKANGRRITGVLTNTLAVSVCLVLANSGSKLVSIGREYPREIVPFADQWMFQLMFPIGFGLLALHFGIRLLEAATGVDPVDPAEIAARKPVEDEGEGDEAEAERSPGEVVEPSKDEAEDEGDAEEEDEAAEEDEDDSADEETDVGVDSEETAPGDAEEPPDDASSSIDESIDENEDEEERR